MFEAEAGGEVTPVMARELADLCRLEMTLRPEDEHYLWTLAGCWQDIAVDCDRDSIGELLAAIAIDLEAA